jgi:hypothetical protein
VEKQPVQVKVTEDEVMKQPTLKIEDPILTSPKVELAL